VIEIYHPRRLEAFWIVRHRDEWHLVPDQHRGWVSRTEYRGEREGLIRLRPQDERRLIERLAIPKGP
jgi:hypothetical protein